MPRRTYTTKRRPRAYKKRTTYKRRTYVKSKTYKRKFNIHSFKVTTQASNVVTGGITGVGYYLTPQPFQTPGNGGLPDAPAYISTYDSFYLQKVKISIVPVYNVNTLSQVVDPSTTANGLKYYIADVHTCIDYNDTSAPTDATEIMNSPTYRRVRMNRTTVRTLYPKIPIEMGATGAFQNASCRNAWINLNTSSISTLAYQGLKLWLDPVANTTLDDSGLPFKVFYTWFFKLKMPQ